MTNGNGGHENKMHRIYEEQLKIADKFKPVFGRDHEFRRFITRKTQGDQARDCGHGSQLLIDFMREDPEAAAVSASLSALDILDMIARGANLPEVAKQAYFADRNPKLLDELTKRSFPSWRKQRKMEDLENSQGEGPNVKTV